MSEVLAFVIRMPAYEAALLDCLQAGRTHLFHAATIERPECSELAFNVEVSTWKTLA